MKLILLLLLINSSFLFAANLNSKKNKTQNESIIIEEPFINYTSSYDFENTIITIETELEKLNIPIFAKFDHYQNAKDVNLDLRKTTVIVFGAPKIGTLLMQANQNIALELPLKLLILENNSGKTIVRFKKMESIAKEYNLENNDIIKKMDQLLENLSQKLIK
ncbi:DUF302 domain-containing protein [Fusobacterium varium]|mgnify:FL=1|uniref:DUF302 domain-containing protein n=1 Tax=Fusobacterium varium TaxID=856 RepID=UPI000BBAFC88|nr:hypothetical protein FV113G1_20600 [Fusobacterium varium]